MSTEHPSAFALEAHWAGEARPEVAEHLKSCESCQAYLTGLSENAEAFEAEEPAERFLHRPRVAAELDRPAPSKARRHLWHWLLGAGVAVCAMGVASAVRPLFSQSSTSGNPSGDVRLKGAPVKVIRLRGSEIARLTGQVGLRAGDRLQVEVQTATSLEIAIALLTDDGETIWLSEGRTLAPGVHVPHDDALEVSEPAVGGRVFVGPPNDVRRALSAPDTPISTVHLVRLVPQEPPSR